MSPPLISPPPFLFVSPGTIAPHNIHAPLQVPQAYADKFSFIKDPNRALYAAKVNFIDDQLATVVAALKAAGMWDNLLFVLTADNGGPIYVSGAPLRRLLARPFSRSWSNGLTPTPTLFFFSALRTTAPRGRTTGP